ncbi:MAG: hypothetical protein IJ632_03145 [Muribaculaceae bacterium]|nr:hypothetical protein [Muribaculaceae bacterium]MBR1551299.1 hypothetical protein [Muribaculaceae bacterium]
MKSLSIVAMMAMIFSGCNAKEVHNKWMTNYGMTPCENPVFVQPTHTVSGGRVRGAGINMNDGEAYSDTRVDFSTEWHYAPKINLCQEEENQWLRITGKEREDLLKFNVKQINGCGAAVIYRDFRARRDEPNLGQILATYDEQAQLLDVMTLAEFYDLEEVLEAACTGAYTFKPNMGSRYLQYTSPGKFTVFSYYYFTKSGQASGEKWEEERDYVIDEQGMVSMTACREKNRPQGLDAPWMLRDISMMPCHDAAAMLDRLVEVRPVLAGNESLLAWHARLVRLIAMRNMAGFLTWCQGHREESISKNALKMIIDEEGPTPQLMDMLIDTINHLNTPVREYWKKALHDRVENQ